MKISLIGAGVMLLGGVSLLLLADTKTDFDHSADFGRYHSYSWLKVQAGNSLWSDRIRRAVDQQLSAKGWTLSQSGGDAAVAAWGATKEQPTMQTFYDGFGGGWGWRSFGGMETSTTTVQNTEVGTLDVDIFASPTKKLIWRGTASKTLSDNPEKNEGKLEKAVEDMFKKFPPPAKG